MKAGEMLIDFINQIFLIGLLIFVLVFIILGDRLGAVYATMQALSPFGFLGLFFVVVFRFSKERTRKMRSEDRLNEILFYLSNPELVRDWLAIFIIPTILFFVPVFLGDVDAMDILQCLIVVSVLAFLHKVVFKKSGDYRADQFLTRLDEIIDEVVLSLLPIMVYGIAFFFSSPNVIDIVQAVLTLVLCYGWHYFFFKLNRR